MLYNPPLFRDAEAQSIRALIEANPLASLVSTSGGEFDVSLLPLLIDEKDGRLSLIGHFARANPHWKRLKDSRRAVALFRGSDFYVSPAWYPSKKVHGKHVPTWNYELVVAEGTVAVTEDPEALRAIVTRLTERFEPPRAAKGGEVWKISDAPAEYVNAMLKAIVGLTLIVEKLEGKRKMSQNREPGDREGVLQGLLAEAVPETSAYLAAMASARRHRTEDR
ncbi:MAG TPA: FMN-binding negative transcriptional regulator [Kiloniellales bacterium]|nr:FMN-binding negative transcriptional regulator [Kiloniellales bacterium]